MSKHSAAIAHIRCPWRKAVAAVAAFITAGTFVPFAYAMHVDSPTDEDDDESSVPPPLHEGHRPVAWPEVSLVHPTRPPVKTPDLHKPTDSRPQSQHTPPPKTVHINPPPKVKPPVVKERPSSQTSVMVMFLRAQLGERYVFGGNGPDIWDCSGLSLAAYRSIGIGLPRTSELQSLRGSRVSLSQLKVGDLLFWGAGPGLAYHVGVYIGSGQYIAAQNPSVGVVERSLSYSPPDFARRIL